MRFWKSVVSILWLTVANSAPTNDHLTPREGKTSRTIETRANPSISGLQFNINGVTQYFAGTNSYWIGFLTNNADVDLVMSHLKSSGLKVLRVWGTAFPFHLRTQK